MNCIACHQKIKISQVVITAPMGDICRSCENDGWEFYETGQGCALRQRPSIEQGESPAEAKPQQPALFDWLALQEADEKIAA